jgi:predicted DNA-binding protein
MRATHKIHNAKLVHYNVRMTEEMKARLQQSSIWLGLSYSDFIRQAIEDACTLAEDGQALQQKLVERLETEPPDFGQEPVLFSEELAADSYTVTESDIEEEASYCDD